MGDVPASSLHHLSSVSPFYLGKIPHQSLDARIRQTAWGGRMVGKAPGDGEGCGACTHNFGDARSWG